MYSAYMFSPDSHLLRICICPMYMCMHGIVHMFCAHICCKCAHYSFAQCPSMLCSCLHVPYIYICLCSMLIWPIHSLICTAVIAQSDIYPYTSLFKAQSYSAPTLIVRICAHSSPLLPMPLLCPCHGCNFM